MDTLSALSFGVFCVGAMLCAFFMVFLLRGQPIAGDTGDRQIVKYRDLELQTNSIILVLIVAAIVAVSPLALQFWLRLKVPPTQTVKAPEEATVYLSGDLRDSSDSTARLAETTLKAINVVTKEALTAKTDQQGHFEFEPIRITPAARRIRLVVNREGYLPLEKIIVADEQNVPIALSKDH
jgi:hypothetical protein